MYFRRCWTVLWEVVLSILLLGHACGIKNSHRYNYKFDRGVDALVTILNVAQ